MKILSAPEQERITQPLAIIEIGGWVRILAEPVCADDGYVWLNVQSAASSSSWTAGGHKTAQWVIPCPDPNKKCSKEQANRIDLSDA